MILSDAFYEDEVREGFFVPAAVKQAWGAELIVLSEIHKICRKHNIMYFAEWGTFLGAIRHGGFIPWDDDLDIGMKRADFKRFMETAPKELPDGFEIYHFRTHETHTRFLSNVVGKARICFEREHLEKYHGFPYITGIDIFILDYVYRDEEKEKERINKAKLMITAADKIFDGSLHGREAEMNLERIAQISGKKLPEGLTKAGLRSYLYGLAEDLFAMVPEAEADYMTRMMPNGLDENNQFLLPKELLNDTVDIPFEEMRIPVLSAYDVMLRKRYGEYMTLYKNASGHNYPYFEAQKENFQKLLDFDLPGLPKVDRQQLVRSSCSHEQREYKKTVLNYLDCMEKIMDGFSMQPDGDYASSASLLQQYAIELGTYMEECKGEGYDLVKLLEAVCDDAYQIYLNQSDVAEVYRTEESAESHGTVKTAEKRNKFQDGILEKLSLLREEVLSRRTVVFLPFKPDYWSAMEPAWNFFGGQEKTEVFVVPIPYYYKNYDFTLRDEQYCLSDYPSYLRVMDYRQFSLAKVHPDVLIIQCPYDSYNETISVSPDYYTLNLRQMTDLLLYIPWFQTDEFTKQNEREYHNMNAYCTMPGVLYADKVLAGSETMRSLYIERLTEFAGEDTRSIWEEKIVSAGVSKTAAESFPATENRDRKKILYGISLSAFMETDRSYLAKIRHVMQILKAYENKIEVTVVFEQCQKEHLLQRCPELSSECENLLRQAIPDINILEFDNPKEDMPYIVDAYDAYYGAAGTAAHFFRNAGKPVMIENPQVLE